MLTSKCKHHITRFDIFFMRFKNLHIKVISLFYSFIYFFMKAACKAILCDVDSHLCRICHQAGEWIPPGSYSEHPWMCPYRCCHSLRYSPHTSLKRQIQWSEMCVSQPDVISPLFRHWFSLCAKAYILHGIAYINPRTERPYVERYVNISWHWQTQRLAQLVHERNTCERYHSITRAFYNRKIRRGELWVPSHFTVYLKDCGMPSLARIWYSKYMRNTVFLGFRYKH